MPIQSKLKLTSISDANFEIVDEAVMRCAYASQNKFGRLFDERIYENDLAARLRAEGFDVHTQVPIRVSHGSFEKTYFLDLVVNQMLYELKVTAALADDHKAQALNYAILLDIRRVKLLNFGEPKVRGHLMRNAILEANRHQPMLRKSGWRILTSNCDRLISHLRAVVQDWGTHLSTQLYNAALVHHFGGEAQGLLRVDVHTNGTHLGTHPVQMHSPHHAFTVTAFTRNHSLYRKHLDTLLNHTNLQAIQWINLNHSRIEITTLEGDGKGMGQGNKV